MSKVAVLYIEIATSSKKQSDAFKKVIAKMKAKSVEMSEVKKDAKMWVDIHFGRNKDQ
ncbi:MAG: hypothetical protein HRT89_01640 [Lentisphaeria bacterium]|nr:hypothetical protein [Lentisphaeria bacterium]